MLIFLFLNNLMTIIYGYSQWLLATNMGFEAYFKSFYSIIDVTYISMTFLVSILLVYQLSNDQSPIMFEQFANITKTQRNLEAICLFMAYTKASYFMSLIDATAPLIDNISEVISDIKFFIVVMLI